MIVQVRGTSGSGKSTVMRRVMERLGEWEPHHVEKRKQPLYYTHKTESITVLGHYESPCGGCDTIGSAAAVYELLVSGEILTDVVLCEGLLLSEDTKWTSQLHDVRVVYLTTPLETCIKQIKQRRADAGNSKPLNVENTTRRVGVIERSRLKLIEAGVSCRRCSPNQAVNVITRWIDEAKHI